MDDIKDLLFEALEAFETDGAEGLQRFYAAHPKEATELKARVRELRDAGLLDEAQRMRTGLPETIDEFRILGSLGEGGMGVVYLAEQPSLGRRVALKLVRPEHLLFPGARERFQREVAVVARLAHPGVVPIHSVGEVGGVPYFAMEAVDGATLAEVLTELRGRTPSALTGVDLLTSLRACRARRGATPGSSASSELFSGSWAQVATRIVLRIAEALAHAHEKGVLHRDIKPGNVMLTEDGRVLLLDFGLASLQGTTRITRTGSLLGSIPYMAPEQLRGDPSDARSDVWSAGVTYYELLTLKLPFAGRNDVEVREAIERATPLPPRSAHDGLPWEVETVCLAALERDPDRRYGGASAFADDLRAILELRPISARRPGPWQQARRAVRRHPVRAAALGFLAVLLVGGPLAYGVIERRARVDIERANQRTKAANIELADALALVTTERNRADAQRARAEARFDDALAAVDTLLRRTAEARLANVRGSAKLRKQLLEDALEFHGRLAEAAPDDPRAREERARSLVRAAELRLDLGQFETALSGADEAIREFAALSPDSQRRSLLEREEARGHELRGRVLAKLSRGSESLAALDEAVGILTRLVAEDPRQPRLRRDLVEAELSAAHALADLGRVGEARELLERIRGELESADFADVPDLWHLRTGAEEGLAVLAAGMGELGLAEASFDRAEAVLREASATRREDSRLRTLLAGVLESRAELAHQQRNWAAARTRIDTALQELTVFAAEERDLPMWPSRLASLLGTSADNRAMLGDPEGALADHRRAIELLDELVRRYPDDLEHVNRLGLAHAVHGGTLQQLGQVDAAAAELALAAAGLERVLAVRPADDQCRSNLAAALAQSAELAQARGEDEAAKELIARALEHSRARRAGGGPGPLVEVLTLAGALASERDEVAATREAFHEATEVARAWWQRSPEDRGRAFLFGSAAGNLGSFAIGQGELDSAEAILDEALEAARVAAEDGPSAAPQLLAIVLMELAHLADARGDAARARECYEHARSEAEVTDENYLELFAAYPRARSLYERLRDDR